MELTQVHIQSVTEKSSGYYPNGMAESFGELSKLVGATNQMPGYMNQSAKRLLMFAPDARILEYNFR